MKPTGLGWLGVRTERVEDLRQIRQERDVAGLAFPDGTEVEVWRPEDEFHSFFGAGPVVGFRVEDFGDVRARMEAEGVEFLGPVRRSEKAVWVHFRGPDGNVYELIGQRREGRPPAYLRVGSFFVGASTPPRETTENPPLRHRMSRGAKG